MPVKKEEAPSLPRILQVFGREGREWEVTVPGYARVTFGPFSPPGSGSGGDYDSKRRGTIRVYGKTKEDMLAVISDVEGFIDKSLVGRVETTPPQLRPVRPEDVPF